VFWERETSGKLIFTRVNAISEGRGVVPQTMRTKRPTFLSRCASLFRAQELLKLNYSIFFPQIQCFCAWILISSILPKFVRCDFARLRNIESIENIFLNLIIAL
jgi:hypothetical protein